MMDESFLDRMISQLRSTCKYYTGYPKDLGPSRIIPFTTDRQFVQMLHEGRPVVVAFTIKCTYTQHLDKVLEEAAASFYPHIKWNAQSIQDFASQDKGMSIRLLKYFTTQNRLLAKERAWILTSQSIP